MAPILLWFWDSITPASQSTQTPNLQPRKYVSGAGVGGGNGGPVNPIALGVGLGIGIPILVALIILYWKQERKKKKKREEDQVEEDILTAELKTRLPRLGARGMAETRGPSVSASRPSTVSPGLGSKSGRGGGIGGDRPRNLGLLDNTTPLP